MTNGRELSCSRMGSILLGPEYRVSKLVTDACMGTSACPSAMTQTSDGSVTTAHRSLASMRLRRSAPCQAQTQHGADGRRLEVRPLGQQAAARHLGTARRSHVDADLAALAAVQAIDDHGPVSSIRHCVSPSSRKSGGVAHHRCGRLSDWSVARGRRTLSHPVSLRLHRAGRCGSARSPLGPACR